MKVKIKLSKDAKMPTYGTRGAAGADLYAATSVTIPSGGRCLIPTGVSVEIPEGHFCYVMGRSGNTIKRGLCVALGLVDEDYRGEIGVMAFNQSDEAISFAKGNRVAQMVIRKKILQHALKVDVSQKNIDKYGEEVVNRRILTPLCLIGVAYDFWQDKLKNIQFRQECKMHQKRYTHYSIMVYSVGMVLCMAH